ncbi:hypothetical protein CYMTET_41750 [Cymbomonas tetramitiformis]|uniref:Peptidase M14 domain-containing protein n=1 Tax=Cymbomonas tetramitiformis TaxID=36881 RepID=A0AAE0C5G3_9CHLO|nr:hypothetical protein CYMTET_41750 [Cymbomonas tetramitiformis]
MPKILRAFLIFLAFGKPTTEARLTTNPRTYQDQRAISKGYQLPQAGHSRVSELARATISQQNNQGSYHQPAQTAQLRGAQHRRAPFAQPDWTYYHTAEDTLKMIDEIVAQHPDTMSSQIHRKTLDGYSSELTVITIEPGGRDTPREDKIRVLMNFAQHGREIITSEVALRLLEKLAKSPELVASEFTASQADAQKLESMLRNSVILVSPMENINGRRMVEGGKLCERKNGHGVDTNRNWAVDWGKKEKDYDPSEEYPGKEPLSEPESFMLHELLLSFQPHAWVNVHSGMEALFMPYDHQARIPETRGAQAMLSLLNAINTGHCKGRCVVGSGGKSVGYLAHGTATDYIYERLQVPVVFTWEIYGDQKAHVNDCFRMFNPVSPAGYEDVVSSWVAASFTLLRLLDSHPLIPTLHASSPQGVAAVTNTEDLQSGDPSRTGATPAEEPAVLSTERASIAVPETVTKALQVRDHSGAMPMEVASTPHAQAPELDPVLLATVVPHPPARGSASKMNAVPRVTDLLMLFLVGLIVGVCAIQQMRNCCAPQFRRYNRRRNREVPV